MSVGAAHRLKANTIIIKSSPPPKNPPEHSPDHEEGGGEEIVRVLLLRGRLHRPREHGAIVHGTQEADEVCGDGRHYVPYEQPVDNPFCWPRRRGSSEDGGSKGRGGQGTGVGYTSTARTRLRFVSIFAALVEKSNRACMSWLPYPPCSGELTSLVLASIKLLVKSIRLLPLFFVLMFPKPYKLSARHQSRHMFLPPLGVSAGSAVLVTSLTHTVQ